MHGNLKSLPPFPEALKHVWHCYRRLLATREVGFAVGPITYAEIGAFNRETHAGLSGWDKELIRDLDDLARGISAGQIDPATCKPKTTSVAGLRATLRSAIAARKAKAEAEGAK